MSAPRVLALFAHPDDAELLCGGTLALLADLGWRVHLAAMSPGDLGSPTLDREAIAAIRREEGRQAAALLKGVWHCLEARDLSIFFCDELCRRATALIRRVAPDLVLTHSPTDYLADHEETARIVAHACFATPVRLYAAEFGSDSEAPPRAAHPGQSQRLVAVHLEVREHDAQRRRGGQQHLALANGGEVHAHLSPLVAGGTGPQCHAPL